jgi:DNA-binding beta-propeller fold protein YncE
MDSFKRLLQVISLLSLAGLAGCLSSTLTNLLVTSVDITPANPTIAVGATQQLTLSVTYVDGTTNHENPDKTGWMSDNAAVATINSMGVATAVAAGTAHIRGFYQGNDKTTLLTVTAPANVAIALRGDSRVLSVTNLRTGQQMSFAADGLRDSIVISRGGGASSAGSDVASENWASGNRASENGATESRAGNENAGASEREISVLPERGPAWLAVDPSAKYLYVVNHSSESVSVFAIDWKTGALTAVPFSPFSAGAKPWSVEVDPDGSGVSVTHFQNAEVSHFRVEPTTGALKAFGEN